VFETVDLIYGIHCEAGEGCLKECPHSFSNGTTPKLIETWNADMETEMKAMDEEAHHV
jgi:hypothetical protein